MRSLVLGGALAGLVAASCERGPERLDPLPAAIVRISERASVLAEVASQSQMVSPSAGEADAEEATSSARRTLEGTDADEAGREPTAGHDEEALELAYDDVEDWGDVWEQIQRAEQARETVGYEEPPFQTELPEEGEAPEGDEERDEALAGADAEPLLAGDEALPAEGALPEGAAAPLPAGDEVLSSEDARAFAEEEAQAFAEEEAQAEAERERLRALEQQTAELAEQLRQEQHRTASLDANLSQAIWVVMLSQQIRLLQLSLVLGQHEAAPLTPPSPPANAPAPPPPGTVPVP